MDFGVTLATSAQSWRVVKRAEELGFTRAWFYDTQLLSADPFVAMAATAMKTSKIRLATGVLIPSNRIAPVAANGLASLNALAPGRIDFGISTGSTARRAMGLDQIKQADMTEYIRVVRALLAGETVEWEFEGKHRKIRFLNPELGLIKIDDEIPLHISAFGPRGRRLTAELGAGWLTASGSVPHASAALTDMQTAWEGAGRDPKALYTSVLVGGCVLAEGEPADSARAKAQAGPYATLRLHHYAEAAETGASQGGRMTPPPDLVEIGERYREVYRSYQPEDARYLSNHRGHLMFLRPEEQPFCTAELIASTTFTATKAELQDRVRALQEAGYSHFSISVMEGHPEMLEEWAEVLHGL